MDSRLKIALRDVTDWLLSQRGDFTYGPYPGGDPRRFYPDVESNTEAELDRWLEACRRAEFGDTPPIDEGPECVSMGSGKVFTGEGFGLGIYRYGGPGGWLLPAGVAAVARGIHG